MNIPTNQKNTRDLIINKIQARSLLRKSKKVDSWFLSRYGMNLYRGCSHDCVYCDGRAEKYNVDGEFGKEIAAKINAPELLRKELNPARKRKPMKPGYIMIGGGVGDSYQHPEKEFQLTRKVLHVVNEYYFPVHILTKSTMVTRDEDIIKEIHQEKQAIVSFSFSSTDASVSQVFEPGVSPPLERLNTISHLKKAGIFCGVYYMPVIPYISDSISMMDKALADFKEAGADFVVFGSMTLKQGRQKDCFMNVLEKHFPTRVHDYNLLYDDNQWGNAKISYYKSLNKQFYFLAKKYHLPIRMPARIFKKMINENDRIVAILEQMDYILKLQNKKTPYSYGAYAISKLEEPASSVKDLTKLKGIGPVTEKLIKEIIKTGTCRYYEKLMHFE